MTTTILLLARFATHMQAATAIAIVAAVVVLTITGCTP